MTNWKPELSELLYSTVRAGGSRHLADLWSSWTSEIAADFWALQLSNFASVMGLYEVVTGSSDRVFRVIPGDPHPMPYLRVMPGLTFCQSAIGSDPWDDFRRVWQLLYPINAVRAEPASIAQELNLLPTICKAVSTTKMSAFLGSSLEQILPADVASPNRIRKFLNHDMSDLKIIFGFRKQRIFDGLYADGIIQGKVHKKFKEDDRISLQEIIQLKSDGIDHGMSGAAVFDTQTNRVIGIVSEYLATSSNVDKNLAMAIQIESIIKVYSELKDRNPGLNPKLSNITEFLKEIGLEGELYELIDEVYVPPVEYDDIKNALERDNIVFIVGTKRSFCAK